MRRRTFLGTTVVALASSSSLARLQPASKGEQPTPAKRDLAAQKALGWELGTQAWTFRDRSAFETIDTAKLLGLTCIELFPGQVMSPDSKDLKVDASMTAAQRSELKGKLDSAGVRANSFGVVGFSMDEKAARAIFQFAKDMGMRGIACEPEYTTETAPGKTPVNAWTLVDKLTREYGLYAAAHNHPKPSRYWDPEVFLAATKGMNNKLLGTCSDTGHWVRSGLVPAECLKKLAGRTFELHFKDVKDDADRPWGTGGGDARGQLAELKRQGFKGPIFLEYETGAGREIEESARKCIEFFDKTARELA